MAYMALYRKWRPQDFSDLIGQEHISETLSNAITTGKVAHAYLFSGPRGTGKTSTAKILAKALNCEHGPTPNPCNKCSCCQKINDGSFMDVFEIDAASNRGIDEIRDLRETVKFAPVDGKYKVYIIDEVHMLTTEAFNALLKTLEEPPSHVVFILATTEVHKVPITIQSRCQRYDFKRITQDDILKRLVSITDKMQIQVEQEALSVIAIQADGGMRDALSLLDQCLAFTKNELTVEEVRKVLGLVGHDWVWQIAEFLAKKDAQNIMLILDKVIAQGKEIKQLLNELTLHFRSMMLYKASHKLFNLNMYYEDEAILKQQVELFTHEQLVNIIQKIHEAISEIRWANQPRITAEVLFLKLCWNVETKTTEPTKPVDTISTNSLNNTNASQAKIMALEQSVARLDRIVKALSSQLANLQENPMPKAQPATMASTPVVSTPMMNTNNRQIAPPNRSSSATRPMPTPPVQQQSVPVTAMPMENADALAIWQNVLAGLNARRKKVVVACVNRALPYKVADNQFFIHFDSPFLQSRTEKDDYRLLIEEVLQTVTGHNLRLVCTCGDSNKIMTTPATVSVSPQVAPAPTLKAPKVTIPMIEDEDIVPQGDYQSDIPMPTDDDYMVSESDSAVDYDNLTPEGRNALQTAIEIFGGKVIAEDEE